MKASAIDSIVIQCSATREGQDIRAADIEKWHLERNFKCIGYNYVIDIDGTVEVGRPTSMDGAHCNTSGASGKPYNKHSIGICYVGGLDKDGNAKDTRTLEQKKAMMDLVYNLFNTFPIVDILGHRDTSPDLNSDGKITKNEWIKMCPCFDVRAEFPIAVCTAKREK